VLLVIDEVEREFEVTASVTAYHPAVIRMDPNDSCDAEGGEVEYLEVWELTDGKREPVELATFDKLCEAADFSQRRFDEDLFKQAEREYADGWDDYCADRAEDE
jgi:hypothetical protein